MKSIRFAAILSVLLAMVLTQRTLLAAPSPAHLARSATVERVQRLPLSFEVNRGQTDNRVSYLAHGPGYTMFLTGSDAVLAFARPAGALPAVAATAKGVFSALHRAARPANRGVVRLHTLGANAHPAVVGQRRLPGKANYFLGNNPRHWYTNIPTYARVVERNVYHAIDLAYYGSAGRLEYDWVLRPHANPNAIRFTLEGAGARLDAHGNIVLRTRGGEIVQAKPAIYQKIGGIRKLVSGRYVFRGGRIGFTLGRYDTRRPLTIDPVIYYSGLIGGSAAQAGSGIALGSDGSIYITGQTTSTDFPTVNPIPNQTALHPGTCGTAPNTGPCGDGYVTKLNPAGKTLVYSTYVGGSASDTGGSIGVDASGNASVLGFTLSSDFPTANADEPTYKGGANGNNFVLELNSAGNGLVFSTYLGGSGGEAGGDLAVDTSGNIYVTGATFSTDFPTKNPLQSSLKGVGNAEVTKFDPNGVKVYGTYLGGNNFDWGRALAVDSSGNVYVTGSTDSPDFPGPHPLATGNAYHNFTCGTGANAFACDDAFVAIINAAGNAVTASAYLGSSGEDFGLGIALDRAGNVDVTGSTQWTDFPTKNPLTGGDKFHGASDIFLSQLNGSLSALNFSTYFGGSGSNSDFDLKVDSAGNIVIAGSTNSSDFPIKDPVAGQDKLHSGTCGTAPNTFPCRDGFVASISPTAGIIYSTFLGGSGDDLIGDLALDATGHVYVVGLSKSSDFPSAVITTKHSGPTNILVAKVGPSPTPTATSVPPAKKVIKCKKGYKKVKGKCKKKK
ncbi:MAG TPA: SBBP repeat-containing protein [Chloroflexota bacterium]